MGVSDYVKSRFAAGARLVLMVVLFAPLLLAIHASPALACQCVPRTLLHHVAGADVVFVGRLREIDGPPADRLMWSSMDTVDYQFDVQNVLKGAVPVSATVRSVVSDGSGCGLERMSLGDRYTVFAVARDGSLVSSSCSGTYAGGPDPAPVLVNGALLPPIPGSPPSWVLVLIALAVILAASVGLRAVHKSS
jgi:hypothetical protein